MNEGVEVSELQSWLRAVLGEDPDWEVTPDTIRTLASIRQNNINQEACAKILKADLIRRKEEYIGEAKRIQNILSAVGLTDQLLAGPASAYLEVLCESCVLLGEDSCGSGGLELSLADQLLLQADQAPALSSAKRQVDDIKMNTVELLSQLDRVTAAVALAEREGRAEAATAANQTKKLDFMRAKEREYRASLDKKEALLAKNGDDVTLRHSHVTSLAAELSELQNKVEEAQREATGFLKLPASCDLAKVELRKAESQLKNLSEAVNSKLATMHL